MGQIMILEGDINNLKGGIIATTQSNKKSFSSISCYDYETFEGILKEMRRYCEIEQEISENVSNYITTPSMTIEHTGPLYLRPLDHWLIKGEKKPKKILEDIVSYYIDTYEEQLASRPSPDKFLELATSLINRNNRQKRNRIKLLYGNKPYKQDVAHFLRCLHHNNKKLAELYAQKIRMIIEENYEEAGKLAKEITKSTSYSAHAS